MGKTITQRSKQRKQNRSHRLNCDQSLTLSTKSYIVIKSDVFLDWEEVSFGIVRKIDLICDIVLWSGLCVVYLPSTNNDAASS